ncbi:hypothetical protein BX667DRAFT_502528 [Coemansia mojavensis]|nr:hypothetical protein BX667DRAFT_502528 [Coemansia mojavensis]
MRAAPARRRRRVQLRRLADAPDVAALLLGAGPEPPPGALRHVAGNRVVVRGLLVLGAAAVQGRVRGREAQHACQRRLGGRGRPVAFWVVGIGVGQAVLVDVGGHRRAGRGRLQIYRLHLRSGAVARVRSLLRAAVLPAARAQRIDVADDVVHAAHHVGQPAADRFGHAAAHNLAYRDLPLGLLRVRSERPRQLNHGRFARAVRRRRR